MHFCEEEATLFHIFCDPALYSCAYDLPQALPFCFSVRVPEFNIQPRRYQTLARRRGMVSAQISATPPLHRGQNKVVVGVGARLCGAHTTHHLQMNGMQTPHEANTIFAIEIDHKQSVLSSHASPHHSFRLRRLWQLATVVHAVRYRLRALVNFVTPYRSLHPRRSRFTAGVDTHHTSRGYHYFAMIDLLGALGNWQRQIVPQNTNSIWGVPDRDCVFTQKKNSFSKRTVVTTR